MVTGWLKLHLIHQFFDVLSDNGWRSTGRFEFWRAYYGEMDEVYFAISRAALRSSNADLESFVRDADGLIFELTQGSRRNHAFIMCMKDVAVVEFSEHGNAAYRYWRGDLDLGAPGRAISIQALKRDFGQQMRHTGANGLTWQERFAIALPKAASPPQNEVSGEVILEYAQRQRIAIVDRRYMGGKLCLKVDNADPDINRQLRAWGFIYKAGEGWGRAA